MRFTEGRRASGSSTRARPAGRSPPKESRKPPRGLDLRRPSRVRLCSVFKEPVPSSGGFPVSRSEARKSSLFFGALGGRPRKGRISICSRGLLAGKIGPGHRRGSGRYGRRSRMSSAFLRGREEFLRPSPPRVRAGAERRFTPAPGVRPSALQMKEFWPIHAPARDWKRGEGLGRPDVTERRRPAARAAPSQTRGDRSPQAGKRSRRPSTLQPPARSRERVAA